MRKIAFCFLIYDQIIHEDLWDFFFKNIDPNKYSIYIHYKTNSPLKYFEKYKLTNCIETRYENHTIPLAYNILFRAAYDDIDNYKFMNLSDSCIPMKSFDYIYNQLTNDSLGYFNTCPQRHCGGYCDSLIYKGEEFWKKLGWDRAELQKAQVDRPQAQADRPQAELPRLQAELPWRLDQSPISKSHNWFILNRKLVEQLCFHDKDNFIKEHYNVIYAPAEYFYYTFIRLLKLEKEIHTTYIGSNDASTFTNWGANEMIYKYPMLESTLKCYQTISEEELGYLLTSKCLFGRKFSNACAPFLKIKIYYDSISSGF